jgi:hypothetical protein
MPMIRTALCICAFLLAPGVHAQTPSATQRFPLASVTGLIAKNVTLKAVQYQGRKALLLTVPPSSPGGFALVSGTGFQDGTIEADIALKTTTPPGVRMPGYIGIAFRARPDASHYDLFYVRPGNSGAQDQAMRNHSVQYVAMPDFDWYRLRREWPWVYESYAPLQLETWTKVKIVVKGRSATLYLNGSNLPSLIVSGLLDSDLRGGVALWGDQGEDAYFSNLRITNTAPQPIQNGSDATGTWRVRFASDVGTVAGVLKLVRHESQLSGNWSGGLGENLPVQGTWRNGYVDLTFSGSCSKSAPPATAHLAGWIDGASAQGRMEITGCASGPWTATKP